ncbi:helix-turn-helix transcriptional regulator [Pikeienuella sp. HZG-20]|uniref:helix-turn-helix domain-containing protein n=1 Tax=Paludibacillus litoralis TaxID=3133267 RepID=UPI0030EE0091
MSTLREYLLTTGTTQAAFADVVGLKQSTVSRLARGATLPSLTVAIAIDRATKGAVAASSWPVPTALERSAK